MTFSPTEREVDLAQFCLMLSSEQMADRFLQLYGDFALKYTETPWWRWRKRRVIVEYENACVRLFEMFHRHAQEQRHAAA